MTDRALLLAPSRGLGGGIERYVETVEWAFATQGVGYQRVDLCKPGVAAHVRMYLEARKLLPAGARSTRLVLAHRALIPVASLLARQPSVSGISVVCHGSDVWSTRLRPRSYLERRLMRCADVRVVAVSSFTAGALSGDQQATILAPGLSREWFRTLVDASQLHRPQGPGIHLVTAFRLADWEEKGLPQMLDAVAALGRTDVHVTICGIGKPSPSLKRLVSNNRYCTLRSALTDLELARVFASADLFILATRTRSGRNPSGEGFGLVLLEAQVAGTPVVAPAYGGSHDAFIDEVTGVAPSDESAEALATILEELLKDPQRLEKMGRRAAEWARECHAPDRYATRAAATLL